MSKHDDEIIAKYTSGERSQFMRKAADALGGIDRVENGYFIMGNGTPVNIQPKSMFERWDEEERNLPADWLIHDK